MKTTFRKCIIDNANELQKFSKKTFSETFCNLNTPSNMEAYLEQAYNIDKLRRELSNNGSVFYFLYADGELAGYIKLNESPAQSDINDPQSLEIERIYVAKEFQGKGHGNALMNKAIAIANSREKAYIWLGVWEKNEKAILFYQKNGFNKIGTHSFFIGEDEQIDFIMRKDL